MADYITLQELKNTAELVGVNFADYDATMAIAAASRGIDQYTGRQFSLDAGTTNARYYTPVAPWRQLDIDDLVTGGTIPTVEVDNNNDGSFETTWTLDTHYTLEPLNAPADSWPYETLRVRPWAGVWFPPWPRSVRITGQFGWETVPDTVKEATTIMAIRLLRRAREAPFGVVGLGVDNVGVRISRTDPDICFLLDNYIRGQSVPVA